MTAKLRTFFDWFRDSQAPTPTRETRVSGREISRAHAQDKIREARRVRYDEPHYYVFYYPPGRGPGSGWKYPKQYLGPFVTKAKAQDATQKELKRYGDQRSAYKVKRLTADQFEEIWGSPPTPPEEQ
jgi:hypothetical protein